jgi:hypothetical protein
MTARTADLQNSIEGIGSAFESFQAKHDNFVADHKVRQAEIVDRLEQLEARASGPGKTSVEREADREMKVFEKFVRTGDLERKDMSIGSGADAVFFKSLAITPLRNLMRDISPLQQRKVSGYA